MGDFGGGCLASAIIILKKCKIGILSNDNTNYNMVHVRMKLPYINETLEDWK